MYECCFAEYRKIANQKTQGFRLAVYVFDSR